MADVLTRLHDGWVEVTLNRPERRNAITGPLADELAAVLGELNRSNTLRVVVLRGSEGAFCSGLDIKEFGAEPPPRWVSEFSSKWRAVHRALFDCPHALIGALEKYAINGGSALALACDYLIVGESSFLQIGEVRLGMGAPYNLAWLRLRHAEAVAANLALTGRRVAGEELVRLGIAQECVAEGAVVERARELASEWASFPDGSVQRIKSLARTYSTDATADEWFDRATSLVSGANRLSG
jgi:enoyl-CoA hydratase/carnithine racemase